MNQNYSAFLVDLDGTLLGRDEKISPPVAEAVSQLSKKIPVCIATGRDSGDVIAFARELGLTAPQICDNGALILDPTTGKELWSAPLEKSHILRIANTIIAKNLQFMATHSGGTVTRIEDLSRWDITRVSSLDVPEGIADDLVNLFDALSGLQAVKASLPYNGLWAVNVTCAGVTKGSAAKRLGRVLGLETASMIGAGDSYNDLPMLEVCGLRIAMGEAPEELKALADYVAPSVDDDGLAVAIEEFVLPTLS